MTSQPTWTRKPKYVASFGNYSLEVQGCSEPECSALHWSIYDDDQDLREGDADTVEQAKGEATAALQGLLDEGLDDWLGGLSS